MRDLGDANLAARAAAGDEAVDKIADAGLVVVDADWLRQTEATLETAGRWRDMILKQRSLAEDGFTPETLARAWEMAGDVVAAEDALVDALGEANVESKVMN